MNQFINHTINSRTLTTYHSIEKELKIDARKNYLFDLSYLQVLNINGDKAIEFLQGQLTCDVNTISDIQIIQGAQCNLKGRILALMDILNWQGVKLVLPNDLVESTINSLSKTALLSRVTIKKSEQLQVLGFYLQNPEDILPCATFFPDTLYSKAQGSNFCYYHLGHGFYIFIISTNEKNIFCKSFIEQNQMLGSLTWHSLRLNHKQFEIYPESRGLFLPHRVDLHQTPMISFDKGCYKGQEIIARTHYRATLKHELKLFIIQTNENLFSGQQILNNDHEYGELVDYTILDTNKYLIVASVLKDPVKTVIFKGHNESIELESL